MPMLRPQIIYVENTPMQPDDYLLAYDPPNYPVPVLLNMADSHGQYHSIHRWFDNFDGFWDDGASTARSVSH